MRIVSIKNEDNHKPSIKTQLFLMNIRFTLVNVRNVSIFLVANSIQPVVIGPCWHHSEESEASVTSLPAWCCAAHVRMSVSVGAELGPVRLRVRRRSDEGR